MNLTSFVFLIAGRIAIARNDVPLHRKRMLTAFADVDDLPRLVPDPLRDDGRAQVSRATGWDKTLYLFILFSHMALAVVLVPLLLDGAASARSRSQFEAHKRIVQATRGRSGSTCQRRA